MGFWVLAQALRGFQIYPKLSASPAGILRCAEGGWALQLSWVSAGRSCLARLGVWVPRKTTPPQGLPHTPTWGVTSRGTLKSHVECIIEVDMATQLSSLETHVIITENSENAEKHVK